MKIGSLKNKMKKKLMKAINLAHDQYEADGDIITLSKTLKTAHKTYHKDRLNVKAIKIMQDDIAGIGKKHLKDNLLERQK